MSQFHKTQGQVEDITLGTLRVGQQARIKQVRVVEGLGQRLLALGLLPGARIAAVQVAPLGDPIAYDCQGRRLSLRREETLGITIEPLS